MSRLFSFSIWFVSLRLAATLLLTTLARAPFDVRGAICQLSMAVVACAFASMVAALEPGCRRTAAVSAVLIAPLVGAALQLMTRWGHLNAGAVLVAIGTWFGIAGVAWNADRVARKGPLPTLGKRLRASDL